MNFMPGLRELKLDDPIHERIDLTPVQPVHDCSRMQIHRQIKQLGGAYFISMAAPHHRLQHAGGTAWIAYLRARWLQLKGLLSESDVWLVVVTALVHDCGHWAFSHILERCFGNHNKRAVELVLGELAPYIRQCGIKPVGVDPQRVVAILEGHDILSDLIKPLIGADKLDYLQRDLYSLTGERRRFDPLYTDLVDWDPAGGLYVKKEGKALARELAQTFFSNFTSHYENPNMRVVQRPIQELIRLMVDCDQTIKARLYDAGEDEIMGSIGYWAASPGNAGSECAIRHRRLLSRNFPKKTLIFTPWPSYLSVDSDEKLAKLEIDEKYLAISEGWSVPMVAERERQIAEILGTTPDAVSLAVSPPLHRWQVPKVKVWDSGEIRDLGDVVPELHETARSYAKEACNIIVALDEGLRSRVAGDPGSRIAVREVIEAS